MSQWYYSVEGTRMGPVSDSELRGLAKAGKLKPNDLVWRKGMDAWVAAANIKGLFPEPEQLPPPLPGDEPPPLPRTSLGQRRTSDDDRITWEAWQIWVFSIVTLGFFAFYLVPSWSKPVERVTGKQRMPFGAVLTLGIFTLGIALMVFEIVYAFDLAKHGQRAGTTGSNRQLGSWVLALNVIAVVWSVATAGIGFLLGGAVLGILATWLIQAEINLYAEE